MSTSQAALLLSTQGLTNAQIAETLVTKEGSTADAYQAMVEAGLLKSKQALTNAELQNTIATKIGNEEYAKALMSHMGLAVAIEGEEVQTVQLTAKKLQQAIASGLLTEAQAQEIAMTTGVTIAQNKATISTTKLGAALKALKVTMKSNPLLMLATVAPIAISGISKFVDGIIITKKELKALKKEALEQSREITATYKQEQSDLDSTIEKYKDLNEQLTNASLTTEEYNAIKTQLSSLQDDLVSKYGEEASAIDIVNGKYDEQIKKLETISREKAQDFVNENSSNIKED